MEKKCIVINEKQYNRMKIKNVFKEKAEQKLISDLLTEAFYPSAELVSLIKDFLDKNFARQELDDLNPNGYPIKRKTVVMLSKDGQPLKTLTIEGKDSELLLLLNDKFKNKISKDSDRIKFLKQVISDWYYRRIKNGILSVNYL